MHLVFFGLEIIEESIDAEKLVVAFPDDVSLCLWKFVPRRRDVDFFFLAVPMMVSLQQGSYRRSWVFIALKDLKD